MTARGSDEQSGLITWKAAFGMRDEAGMRAVHVRADDLLQEGLVRQYRNGVRVKRGTLRLIPGRTSTRTGRLNV